MDEQYIERLKLLQRIYNELLENEEALGWPGDSPHWELRQHIKKILDDNEQYLNL